MGFGVNWKAILFFPILFLLAIFSTSYKRIIRIPPAFELVSLTTVVVGMTHGIWAGALFGAVTAFIAEIINGSIDPFIIGYVFGRAIMGALSGAIAIYFPGSTIVFVGMLLLIMFNIIAQSLYLLQGDPSARMKTFFYVSANLIINWYLFRVFGGPLISLLS